VKYSKNKIMETEIERIICLLRQLKVFIKMPYKKKPRNSHNNVWKKINKKI